MDDLLRLVRADLERQGQRFERCSFGAGDAMVDERHVRRETEHARPVIA